MRRAFTDAAGREWSVSISVTAIKRVRASLGVDLYKLLDDGFAGLSSLLGDPVSLVDVIYVLCRGQADAAGVSDEAFGEAMAGDALESATSAFCGALVDFFPNPRARAAMERLLATGETLREKVLDRAEAELASLDADRLADALSRSSGSSPESSDSIPAPSPSAS
jgi:hypothetical protein